MKLPEPSGRAGDCPGDAPPWYKPRHGRWHASPVSRKNPRRAPGGAGAPVSDADLARHARAAEEAERVAELESWVGTWLSLPEAADRQGVPLAAVRRQLQDRELVAVRRGPNRALAIPEAFVTPAGPRGDLRGTFTVLADGGMDDVELLGWLFAPDDSFEGGCPMGALLAGRKTEVRRRAMETAF